MAAANKRQPPPGYPTGGNAEEDSRVDNNDENETDRGISARFMIGRPKPRSHERYPGPGLGLVPFDDYVPPPPPRGPHRAPGYDYPPPHGYGVRRHQTPVEFEVSDEEDEDEYEYENGYGHQQIPYGKKPQQFYRRETYVVEPSPPPPPPRRRPVAYAPQGNYSVRDEYVRY